MASTLTKGNSTRKKRGSVSCFLIEPSGRIARYLRRYGGQFGSCSASGVGYHNALLRVDDTGAHYAPDETPRALQFDDIRDDDYRWPHYCACGYEFQPDDSRHVFTELIYHNALTDESYPLSNAPVGSIWYAPWFPRTWATDGRCVMVKTPGGDWCPDGPTLPSGGRAQLWRREGVAPYITVTPNITINNWSGRLVKGELVTDALHTISNYTTPEGLPLERGL